MAHADGITVKILKFVGGWGISETGFALVLFTIALAIVSTVSPGITQTVLFFVLAAAPVWLPIFLGNALWKLWVRYVRMSFWHGQKKTLLEVCVPREIIKSPRAMELVIMGFHTTSRETTFIDRYWYGKQRAIFSLEMVSDAGQISFYIWTERFFKELIEAQIYAQYPEVEVYEVEDYSWKFHYDENKFDLFGTDYKLAESDVLPIKTYEDYELTKDPKEEFKVDPLAHVLELLGQIKQGERLWIQIILQADKELRHKEGTWFGTEPRWKSEANEMVEAIKDEAMIEAPEPGGFPRFRQLTEGQNNRIKAVQRSMDKPAFRVGMRWLYIAEKDKFRGINIPSFLSLWKQFGSGNHNSIRPNGWFITFDYPWQDWRGIRKRKMKHKIVHAYQTREFFYGEYEAPLFPFYVPHGPTHTDPFVMTSDEIATMFHFPSAVIKAPGVRRIPATKAEPPPNLPG